MTPVLGKQTPGKQGKETMRGQARESSGSGNRERHNTIDHVGKARQGRDPSVWPSDYS